MSAINIQDTLNKLHASDASFEKKLLAIVQRDTRHQEAIAARGGTMTSSLGDEAQAAAAEVIRQRDNARAKIARPVIEDERPKIERLKAETAAAGREYLEKHRALAILESQLNGFLASAGHPPQPRVTGQHTENVRQFLDRVERVETAASPRPILQPLQQPRFEDLVSGPSVAIIAAASSPIEH